MFPSPRRALMALGHGQACTATAAAMTASSSSAASTATINFSFQPSPSAPTCDLSRHGLLGYSHIDHPTTTPTSSFSHVPCTIPAAALPNLHVSFLHPAPRSSPPHPWSCDEDDQDRQRGKSAAMGMGAIRINNAAAAGGSRSALHGSAAAAGGLAVGAVRMKKAGGGGKARRKVREPRFCFKTMSDVDVLDDGYKWRKYGQKVVKNTQHPRMSQSTLISIIQEFGSKFTQLDVGGESLLFGKGPWNDDGEGGIELCKGPKFFCTRSYYRCTQDNCRVKKRVERLAEDPRMVITTYEGRHVHSPSRDDDDAARANAEMSFIW